MINILNINVRGLKNSKENYEKINEIRNILEINKINLAVLTESHGHEVNLFNQKYTQIQSTHPKLGITILIDRNIQLIEWKEVIKGRRIDMKTKINNKVIRFSCVYCSADADLSSMKAITKRNKAEILIGDFNIVLNKEDKTTPLSKQTAGAREALQQCIMKNNLIDLSTHFGNKQHTFFRKEYSSKLDRIYANQNLINNFLDYKIITTSSNFDHSGVFTALKFNPDDKSYRYWKVNNNMLTKKIFVDKINRMIADIPNNINTPEDWDTYKNKIKYQIKKIQKFFHHQRNKKLKKLQDYQNNIIRNEPNNYIKIHEIKERIKEINKFANKSKREKVLRNLDKDKNFKISKKMSNFIYNQNPKQLIENKISIEDQEKYYKNIFNQNHIMDEDLIHEMLKNWDAKLTEEEREELMTPITINEIKGILNTRNSNSSPGPDGLTYQFYKKFKNTLLGPMCKLFNILLNGANLTDNMKTSFTIPIFKRKGDANMAENWRPIALSNSDYKIYTTILNQRLSRFNSKLISKNQIGFGRNKFIIDNILILSEILRMNQKKYAILCLDIAKAFDSINHTALFKILEHINTGKFGDCIRQLYMNTQTRIIHNGKLSNPIVITNGVKQGDVISPLLFNIGIDLMTKCLIKQVMGIELHKVRINVLQYADDTTIICGSELDVNSVIRILKQTKRTLNLETNYSKSACISKRIHIPKYIKPVTEERILGYYFNKDKVVNNIDTIIEDLIRRGKNWRKYGGNLSEKSTIWKVFILSKLWYWIWVLQPTFKQINEIYNIQCWFIYHREFDYQANIKYKKSMNEGRANKPHYEGGLGLFYLRDRIKAFKINIIDRALKGKDLLHQVVVNILKRGIDKNNSIIGRFIEYHISFFQKNIELLNNEIMPISCIYGKLIESKLSKIKLTENQMDMESKLRMKYDRIWIIIEEMKILNKFKYFLWRYFNNLLQIPRQSNCKFCGQELTKQHIIFECEEMKKRIDGIMIDKYKICKKRWNQKLTLFLMIKQIDDLSSHVNWSKYRTQIATMYKIWTNFTAIQYGGKTNQAILTHYKEDLINYVNESNHIYRLKKKKRNQKIIKDKADLTIKDKPIFHNKDYAILLNKKRKH